MYAQKKGKLICQQVSKTTSTTSFINFSNLISSNFWSLIMN